MSEPIQIIVTAQTAQALAALQQFVAQGGSQLTLLQKNVAAHGSQLLSQLKQNVVGVNLGVAESGVKATSAMYSLRSAIDAVRFAAAGGGFRALFYAGDEGLRALVASGALAAISFSTLALGAAALTGALAPTAIAGWMAYKAAEEEARTEAELHNQTLKLQKKLIEEVKKAATAGVIDQSEADYLSKLLAIGTPSAINTVQRTLLDEGLTDSAVAAMDDLKKLETKMQEEVFAGEGLHGKILKAQAALDATLTEINAKAVNAGGLYSAEQKAADIAAAKQIYNEVVAGVQKEIGQQDKQEVLAQLQTDLANIRADYEQTKNSQGGKLTTQQQGDQNIQEQSAEYLAYQKLLARGEITQTEFDEKTAELREKGLQVEGQIAAQIKTQNGEKQKALELEQEIARIKTEGELKAIAGNPLLSNQEKAQRSIPLYQNEISQDSARAGQLNSVISNPATDTAARLEAEKQLEEVLNQQVETQNKLNEAAGQTSFAFQFGVQLAAMQSEWGSWAIQFGDTFRQVTKTADSSITSNISGWIERTKSWGTAMRDIAKSVMDDVIQSFVSMGVRWATTQLTMTASSAEGASQRNLIVAGETIWHGLNVAARTAAHIAGEILMTAVSVAQSAIRIGVIIAETIASLIKAAIEAMAAMASIPYVGPVLAVAAMAAILAAGYGVIEGFESGGYTGDGARGEVAGVVHRGEFVVPAHVVDRVGLGNLTAMTSGAQSRGGGGAAGSQRGSRINTNVNIAQFDGKSDAQRWADSQEGEVWFHSKLDKHVQRYTKKS